MTRHKEIPMKRIVGGILAQRQRVSDEDHHPSDEHRA
jgi:hypothetical protein